MIFLVYDQIYPTIAKTNSILVHFETPLRRYSNTKDNSTNMNMVL
jgi:hypothetical protein